VENGAAVARALAAQDYEGRVFAADVALSDRFLEEAGSQATTWRVVHNGLDVEQVAALGGGFSAGYLESYGTPPGLAAANAYDLTNLVIDAVSEHGRDRDRVAERVLATAGYTGVSGEITFNANGDRVMGRMSGYRVEEGRFVLDRVLAVQSR
jgi:branched-chain amino acid transport system substrate-binding protein